MKALQGIFLFIAGGITAVVLLLGLLLGAGVPLRFTRPVQTPAQADDAYAAASAAVEAPEKKIAAVELPPLPPPARLTTEDLVVKPANSGIVPPPPPRPVIVEPVAQARPEPEQPASDQELNVTLQHVITLGGLRSKKAELTRQKLLRLLESRAAVRDVGGELPISETEIWAANIAYMYAGDPTEKQQLYSKAKQLQQESRDALTEANLMAQGTLPIRQPWT